MPVHRDRDQLRELSERVWPLSYKQVLRFYAGVVQRADPLEMKLLGMADRYFLTTCLLGRDKGFHPWLYDRCREVERDPDDHLDLWAREHWKSSFITVAGSIQEVLLNPEITIGIFSHDVSTARKFLNAIKGIFETNGNLKALYPEVLFSEPEKQSPKWSEQDGIQVRREHTYPEQTVEAYGLINAMPTGRHFTLRIYDDVVTENSVTSAEMVAKVNERRDLSDNLGQRGGREWNIGTRYHLMDTYQNLLDRGVLKARVYPATDNGQLDGNPVYLTKAEWQKKKDMQPLTVAAQMLQNPSAGKMSMFDTKWLTAWDVRPHTLHVYIMGDPAHGPRPLEGQAVSARDRTAFAVIGIDGNGNKYLLDGRRHRMNLYDRWEALRTLWKRWSRMPGVLNVQVGYERYGLQSDTEYFEERMRIEKISFAIDEIPKTGQMRRQGPQAKGERIGRLVPDFKKPSLYIPRTVWHESHGEAMWSVNARGEVEYRKLAQTGEFRAATEAILAAKDDKEREAATNWRNALAGHAKRVKDAQDRGRKDLVCRPIKSEDEEGHVYDLVRGMIEEYIYYPYAKHDDLLDAMSRIYDLDPVPPRIIDERELLSGLY